MAVVSHVLPTIFPGDENPGISGNSARSSKPLEPMPPAAVTTADATAGHADSGSDHQPASLGEIVAPEGYPGKGVPTDSTIERSGNAAMGEATGGTAPAQEPCPTGAEQPSAAYEDREGETGKEEDPSSAAILTGESLRSAGVVTDTAAKEDQLGEGELGSTGMAMTATAEGGKEESDSPQPIRPEIRSSCEAVETLEGRPDTAGDDDSGMNSREGQDELTRNWSERKTPRKKKRSELAGSRARSLGKVKTSAGGTSTVSEAPANTPHLQV